MIVTIVKPFGSWSRGQVLPEVPGNVARGWIGRGLAIEGNGLPGQPGEAPPAAETVKPGLVARVVAKAKGKGR